MTLPLDHTAEVRLRAAELISSGLVDLNLLHLILFDLLSLKIDCRGAVRGPWLRRLKLRGFAHLARYHTVVTVTTLRRLS